MYAFHNVRDYKGGGGVAVYVNSDFTCKFLPAQPIVMNELLESISVEVIISGHKNITITCLYRTPGSNLRHFLNCLEQLFSE